MFPDIVLKSNVYNKVINELVRQNIKLIINTYNLKIQSDLPIAFVKPNFDKKEIYFCISEDELNNLSVIFHELFHLEMYLDGYPTVSILPEAELNPFILGLLSSVVNSLQHRFVYKEMNKIGINQEEIDADFFDFIDNQLNNELFGLNRLVIPINLLETYARNPIKAGHFIRKYKLNEIASREMKVYYLMRELFVKSNSPYEMKKKLCKIFKSLELEIMNLSQQELNMGLITIISPIIKKNQLDDALLQHFKIVSFTNSKNQLLIDKESNFACAYLENLNMNLEGITVKEFFDGIEIHYAIA